MRRFETPMPAPRVRLRRILPCRTLANTTEARARTRGEQASRRVSRACDSGIKRSSARSALPGGRTHGVRKPAKTRNGAPEAEIHQKNIRTLLR